jgi:hypothetical protein
VGRAARRKRPRFSTRAGHVAPDAGTAPTTGIHSSRAFLASLYSARDSARASREAGCVVCTTGSFRPTIPAASSPRRTDPRPRFIPGAYVFHVAQPFSPAARAFRHHAPQRVSLAVCPVCVSAGAVSICLAAEHVAPRINSTAHVAHIAQIPVITIHFSISPVL